MLQRIRVAWIAGLVAGVGACDSTDTSTVEGLGVVEPAVVLDEADHVLDTRSADAFAAGHIEGSGSLDAGLLRAVVDGVEGQVASRDQVWAALGAAGLQSEDTVVVTGSDNGTDPARVAWTLRLYGHQGDVLLLDGGMQAYESDGLPVIAASAPPEQSYRGGETREGLRVDKAWMLAHLGDDEVAMFDVRTPEEFEAGHIPGARNVNWESNKRSDGRFRSASEVRALHGNPEASTLVVYCRTGSRAAVSWAVLAQAGYEDVRLYDGSWAEWGSDAETPKE